jgi:hypothetical protein
MSFFNLDLDGNIYLPDEDGHFVSDNQRRVAGVLRDYYPYLQLQWIPPNKRDAEKDYAFRVVDTTPGRPNYVVCFANECDERLLARVFQADQTRPGHNAQSYVDCHNDALEALKLKKRAEANEEAHRMAYSILRSPKIHYKHGGIDFGKIGGGRRA